ncbi:MAG: hypothetical protein ACOYON_08050 [Fimbriimonas sp.]
MATGRFRVWTAVPSAQNYSEVLRRFAAGGPGTVTSLEDPLLAALGPFSQEFPILDLKPFGSVVRELLMLAGRPTAPIAQSGLTRAAVAHACLGLPVTSPFYASRTFTGTHKALVETMDEIASAGLDSEEFERIAEQLAPTTARKLSSLLSLTEQVDETLEALGRQRHNLQLRSSLDEIADRDGGWDRLLVFGQAELSPLQERWLAWLGEQGVETILVLDRHPNSEAFFGLTRALRQDSLALPGKSVNALGAGLFDTPSSELSGLDVAIESSADTLAEVEWALRNCHAHGNLDATAIIAPDMKTYGPLIEAVSHRFRIPIRMTRRVPLLSNGFARFVLRTLEACVSPRFRDLETIALSSYSALDPEDSRALVAGIRNANADHKDPWRALANMDLPQITWLPEFLAWRAQALSADCETTEWFDRLRNFVHILPWHASRPDPRLYHRERDAYAQSAMIRSLSQWASVERALGRGAMNLRTFIQRARMVWEESDVSIPSREAGVLVTSIPEQLGEPELVVVLGLLEGSFPRRRREDSILGDKDRRLISELRPDWPPLLTSFDRAEQVRETFYRICLAPTKRLILSYPRSDGDSDAIPSFFLEEVERAVGDLSTTHHLRDDLAPPSGIAADAAMAEARLAPRSDLLPNELASDLAKTLVRLPSATAGPEDFRQALRCPFQWMARNRLRLYVRQERVRWARLHRLPVMAKIAEQPSEEAIRESLDQALAEELERLAPELDPWEVELLQLVSARSIDEITHREVLARSMWPRRPGSQVFDVEFGTEGILGDKVGPVSLVGAVPAMCEVQDYRVAQLYGTAGWAFSKKPEQYEDPERVFIGALLWAIMDRGGYPAVELDHAGGRTLITLDRVGKNLRSEAPLNVHNLLDSDANSLTVRKKYFAPIAPMLKQVATQMTHPEVSARPGTHCDHCDYGELCRRSKKFGEIDSPFDAAANELDSEADHE